VSIKAGFAVCGSFCSFSKVIPQMQSLVNDNVEVIPIMSQNAAGISTRFGKAEDIRAQIENICGREAITSIEGAEPIGPKKLCDVLIVAPCTGNTLAKMALGVTDTSVTMAVKSHMRNNRPVVLAVSTNDALSNSAINIGKLKNTKNIYFVPMKQDDPAGKPNSMAADFSLIRQTVDNALEGRQINPVMLG